jgi:hypothetical protein
MISPNARALSKMFSTLTGLSVSCVAKPRFTSSSAKLVYGIYNELPEHDTILLRADLHLLASLAGSLVGLPDSLVTARIGGASLDETLRDAIRDVFNYTSTLLSTSHRVVFKSMCTDVQYLNGPARSILNSPVLAATFDVSIPGYTGGQLSIFSDL